MQAQQQQQALTQPTGYTPVYHWQHPAPAQHPAIVQPRITPWAMGVAALIGALAMWFVLDAMYGGDRLRELESRLRVAEVNAADRGRTIQLVQGAVCK